MGISGLVLLLGFSYDPIQSIQVCGIPTRGRCHALPSVREHKERRRPPSFSLGCSIKIWNRWNHLLWPHLWRNALWKKWTCSNWFKPGGNKECWRWPASWIYLPRRRLSIDMWTRSSCVMYIVTSVYYCFLLKNNVDIPVCSIYFRQRRTSKVL